MSMYYILLIFVPTIFSAINDKYSRKNNFFNVIGMIFLLILITFRKNIGVDYITYKNIYYGLDNGLSRMDFGYQWINYVLQFMNLPFSALLFVTGAFSVSVLYYSLNKYKIQYKWFALFLYLGIFDIFIYSLASIRQTIAISFFMLASIMVMERKYIKGYALMLVGALFHWSLLIMIPIFVFMRKMKCIKTYKLILLTILVPIAYKILMSSPLVSILTKLNYSIEFHLSIAEYNTTSSIISVLVYIILCIAWVWFITFVNYVDEKYVVRIIKRSIFNMKTNMDMFEWALVLFLTTKSCLALQYNGAIPRVQMYLYFMLPFAVGKKLEIFNPKVKVFIVVLLILLVMISTNSKIIELYEYYGTPGFGIS